MSKAHSHIQELVGAVKTLDSIAIFGVPSMDKVQIRELVHQQKASRREKRRKILEVI
jgi:hypothetical protein